MYPRVLIYLFLLVSSFCRAQTFYKELGNVGINEGGTIIIPSTDGNYFLGGFKKDSALVMKVDPLGNAIWMRTFKPAKEGSTGANFIYSLEITPDNFLIGGGSLFNNNPFAPQGFYFKMDLSGNMQWCHAETMTERFAIRNIVYTSPTEYVLIGFTNNLLTSPYNDGVSALIDASNGQIKSFQPATNFISSNPYLDDMGLATKGRNNVIYVTGRIYVKGSNPGGMRPILAKYDQKGKFLTANYLQFDLNANARIYGIDIIYDNDNIVISYFGDINGASGNFSPGLIKTDTLGNVIWAKDYNINTSISDIAYKVLKTSYGYALTGYCASGNNDFFIIATDPNGNVLWSNTYGSPGSSEKIEVTVCGNATVDPTDNKSIYFTGNSDLSGDQNIVIAKVDEKGNIDCTSNFKGCTVISTNTPQYSTKCDVSFSAINVTMASQPEYTKVTIPDACSSLPKPKLGADTSFCGGVSYLLNATGNSGSNYKWNTGDTTPTITVTAPGTYWVKLQFNCCVKSDTIIIGTKPGGTFSQHRLLCKGQGISIGTHFYTQPGTYTDTLKTKLGCDSILITTIQPAPTIEFYQTLNICEGNSIKVGAHQYSVSGSYTDTLLTNNKCDSIVTTNLTVHGFTINATTAAATCGSSNGKLDILVNNGIPDFHINVQPGNYNANVVPVHLENLTGNVFYTVTITDSLGCKESTKVFIDNAKGPSISLFAKDISCFGAHDGSINALVTGGTKPISYSWSPNPPAGQGTSVITNLAATHYSVTVLDSNQCSATADITLLEPRDPLQLFVSQDSTQCYGDKHMLQATAQGGTKLYNYLWMPANAIDSTLHIVLQQSSNYTVTVTDQHGCTDSKLITITVYPLPTVTITFTPIISCDSTCVSFTQSAVFAEQKWSFGDGTKSTKYNPSHCYYEKGNFTGELIVTDLNGCSDTAKTSGDITVYPNPIADFTNKSIDNSILDINIQFYNKSTNAKKWTWIFGDGTNSTDFNPLHNYINEGDYEVMLISFNELGCADTTIQIVHAYNEFSFYVPNAFTPNKDLLNETWGPKGTGISKDTYELWIFDRWGNKVFHTTQWGNDWDGTKENGNGDLVPQDSYVWRIVFKDKLKNKEHTYMGTITVAY